MMLDVIGILGVILILVAYMLLQSGKVTSQQYIYPVLNFFGAAFIVISLFKDWNLSAFLIEVCWMGISAYGFIKIRKSKAKL